MFDKRDIKCDLIRKVICNFSNQIYGVGGVGTEHHCYLLVTLNVFHLFEYFMFEIEYYHRTTATSFRCDFIKLYYWRLILRFHIINNYRLLCLSNALIML